MRIFRFCDFSLEVCRNCHVGPRRPEVTGQLAPLHFDPWSTRTLIFRTLIYPSQLALHTVSLLGQLAP